MATENGFVDRAAELKFILTKMDGRQRCDMLGVTLAHYEDSALAKRWYDNLVRDITDRDALDRLSQMYDSMVYF